MKKYLYALVSVIFCVAVVFFFKTTLLISDDPNTVKMVTYISTFLSAILLLVKNKLNSDLAIAIEWAVFAAPTSLLFAQLMK